MKNAKIISLVAAAALAATLGLAGCGGGTQSASSSAASSPAASAASTSAAASSAAAPAASSSAAAASSAAAPASSAAAAPAASAAAPAASAAAPAASAAAPAASAAAPAQATYIGDEAAITAALAHAGFTQADVTELKVELDADEPIIHYDVDFKQGGMEYDYDIDASTGDVLIYKSEVDD